jgi:hypothetical protein
MGSYALNKVAASITGPGGSFQLGSGSALGDEGIEFETNERSVKQVGADGVGQYSFIADKSGTVTVTLLKTSPTNAMLMNMFNAQTLDSSLWGSNVIVLVDTASGTTVTARACAFNKVPPQKFGKEAGTNQWVFDSLYIDTVIGAY